DHMDLKRRSQIVTLTLIGLPLSGTSLEFATPAGNRRSLPVSQVGEVIDDSRHVGRGNRGLVEIAHLVDLALPDGARRGGLGQHHAGRMTRQAVVVDSIRRGAAGEGALAV